jgi:hypothetical protein
MKNDINRGFEVGESTSIIDFFKQKLRPNISETNGVIINSKNPDINQFVE